MERAFGASFFIGAVLKGEIATIVKNEGKYFERPLTAAQAIILFESLYPRDESETDFMEQDRLDSIVNNPFGVNT